MGMMKKTLRDGFTLIELSISLVFIGLLSLAVVLIISNTVNAYRRGLVLTRVNNIGTQLIDEIRSTVREKALSAQALLSSCDKYYYDKEAALNECLEENAWQLVSGTMYDGGGRPTYGAFCTGTYSFLWNSGLFFSDGTGAFDKRNALRIRIDSDEDMMEDYYPGNPDSGEVFKLIKINDTQRLACKKWANYDEGDNIDGDHEPPYILRMPGLDPRTDIVDLLPSEDGDMVLYGLSVDKPAVGADGGGVFYPISFVLGTISGGINVNSSTCEPPKSTVNPNSNYCAINEFNFAAQVGGS